MDQALHHPEEYARHVQEASPTIGGFGGTFLVLLSLGFLLDPERKRRWIAPLEALLARAGRLPNAPVIAGGAALLVTAHLVSPEHREATLLAGLAGLVTFLAVRGFRDLMEGSLDRGRMSGAAGLAGFLYLETLDASFSLDGVLGAFAISSDIVVVAIGLGAGALYVRSLTLFLVRRETLRELPYLTHGAHWAIGALGVFLLVGIERHPPEWLTGGVGLAILAAAWASSLRVRHRGDEG